MISRRGFFSGLAAAIAAPAVVKAEILMPVKVWKPDVWRVYGAVPSMGAWIEPCSILPGRINHVDYATASAIKTVTAQNDLLDHLTFERAEDAFATANRIAQHDLMAFGQCGSIIDHDKRAIRLVRSQQEFSAASESYSGERVERRFHIRPVFGPGYSGEPARFNRGVG